MIHWHEKQARLFFIIIFFSKGVGGVNELTSETKFEIKDFNKIIYIIKWVWEIWETRKTFGITMVYL